VKAKKLPQGEMCKDVVLACSPEVRHDHKTSG